MGGRDTRFRQRFAACRAKGELRYPVCPGCAAPLRYTQRLCPLHPTAEPDFVPASGRARLHTVVTYHTSYSPKQPAPYRLGMFELEEGPRLLGIVEAGTEVGDPVRLAFDEAGRLVGRDAGQGRL